MPALTSHMKGYCAGNHSTLNCQAHWFKQVSGANRRLLQSYQSLLTLYPVEYISNKIIPFQ